MGRNTHTATTMKATITFMVIPTRVQTPKSIAVANEVMRWNIHIPTTTIMKVTITPMLIRTGVQTQRTITVATIIPMAISAAIQRSPKNITVVTVIPMTLCMGTKKGCCSTRLSYLVLNLLS